MQRMISEEIRTSEKIGNVSFGAETLYLRLYTSATDEYGNIDGGTGYCKDKAFPESQTQGHKNNSVSYENVTTWLNELEKSGLITKYFVDGAKYYHFENFEKYQSFRHLRTARVPVAPGQVLDIPKRIRNEQQKTNENELGTNSNKLVQDCSELNKDDLNCSSKFKFKSKLKASLQDKSFREAAAALGKPLDAAAAFLKIQGTVEQILKIRLEDAESRGDPIRNPGKLRKKLEEAFIQNPRQELADWEAEIATRNSKIEAELLREKLYKQSLVEAEKEKGLAEKIANENLECMHKYRNLPENDREKLWAEAKNVAQEECNGEPPNMAIEMVLIRKMKALN